MKKSISPRSLNTDDNKLTLGPQESTFSLNIDAEGFGEDEAGVVKHVRGNAPTSLSDEAVVLPFGSNKIVGSISDDQLNVVYFFVYNNEGQHSVVAYSSTTNTYRTVFVSPALDFKEDSFVKADIVRLRKTPEDQELIVEPPAPPETNTPVEVKFRVSIDFSIWGEKNGYSPSDPAPPIVSTTQVLFSAENGLRLYENAQPVTDETVPLSSYQDQFRGGVDSFDGWLREATFTLFVHPEDLQNASKFLKYRVPNSLGGPTIVANDVSRTITNVEIVQASTTSAEGLQLGSPCYGFTKDINEILVDDIFGPGEDPSTKAFMNTSTATGRVLDRKLPFEASCDYSSTPEWSSALLSLANAYDGSPFESGEQGQRSHPSERFDNGGDQTEGFGGGGGLEALEITFCDNGNWPANGATYETAAQAIAAAYDVDPSAYSSITVVNACPVIGTSTTLEPSMTVYNSKSGSAETFTSDTQVAFDPLLFTIPEKYMFVGKANVSSCGTMKSDAGFVFGGVGGVNSIEEEMPAFVPAALGMYWAPQSDQPQNGFDFGDRISDINTMVVDIQLEGGEQYGNTILRSFELPVNPSNTETNIFKGGQGLSVTGRVWYSGGAGFTGSLPTTTTSLCFNNHSACGADTDNLPPPPRDERFIQDVEDNPPPPIVVTDVTSDEGQEREGTPETSSPDFSISKAKTKAKSK